MVSILRFCQHEHTIQDHLFSRLRARRRGSVDCPRRNRPSNYRQFSLGENSAAYELVINTALQRFEAMLKIIREHSSSVEVAAQAEAIAGSAAIRRTLLRAGVVCGVLVVRLMTYGWRFRDEVSPLRMEESSLCLSALRSLRFNCRSSAIRFDRRFGFLSTIQQQPGSA